MGTDDGFTLAVKPAQALVELFSEGRQAVLQPRDIFRACRTLAVALEVIALQAAKRARANAAGKRNGLA
ncbi:hypothetical protein D3C81_1747190 [compost metagenome]